MGKDGSKTLKIKDIDISLHFRHVFKSEHNSTTNGREKKQKEQYEEAMQGLILFQPRVYEPVLFQNFFLCVLELVKSQAQDSSPRAWAECMFLQSNVSQNLRKICSHFTNLQITESACFSIHFTKIKQNPGEAAQHQEASSVTVVSGVYTPQ